VQARQLDGQARAELKTLSKENADWVARHLVMAATLIDDDPELAHQHALSAARRAGRVSVVRESLAITAYAVGDYALALRELRTHRRISGSNDQLPLMVDSERGLGRPDRALELGRSVPRAELDVPVQVQLAIAMSGARLDLGQPDVALGELEIPQLDPTTAFSWSADLFSAYATVLEEVGRGAEAGDWRRRAEIAAEAFGDVEEDFIEVVEEEVEVDETEDLAGGDEEGTASVALDNEDDFDDDRAESADDGAELEDDEAEALASIEDVPAEDLPHDSAEPGDADEPTEAVDPVEELEGDAAARDEDQSR
jgi:hypothetical protein